MRSRLSWSLTLIVAITIPSQVTAAEPTASGAAAPPPRLPAMANALMKLEVAKVINSPLAKEMGWQEKLSKGYADRPVAVPPTAKRVTVVAGMHPHGMRAIWQAAVIELGTEVRLEPMLRAQGGYLDVIGGKPAAWTPRDVLYVEFDKKTLGVLRPGQRQFVTRWVTGENQPELAPYLARAWSGAVGADVMFAMDLDDLLGATTIAYADSMGDLPSLEKIEQGREKLIGALASVQGLRLTMKVGKAIESQFVVDFGEDVSALGDMAKPFVSDVLRCADIDEPALENWQFKAVGKQIVGTGGMEAEALTRLIAMMAPANAGDAVASGTDGSSPGESPVPAIDPKQEAAYASQKYYRAVAGTLNSMGSKTSPSTAASYFVNKARMIEQLPILNVDPDLVQWGAAVADAFNRAAQELHVGQQKAKVAAEGVASPVAYTTYSPQGGGNSTPETRAAYRNAQQQRRQAAQSERGAAGERAMTIMNQVLPTRGKIRADMTQKYGVEF
jgi:hypothetical protein